jgi:hypothetical protein
MMLSLSLAKMVSSFIPWQFSLQTVSSCQVYGSLNQVLLLRVFVLSHKQNQRKSFSHRNQKNAIYWSPTAEAVSVRHQCQAKSELLMFSKCLNASFTIWHAHDKVWQLDKLPADDRNKEIRKFKNSSGVSKWLFPLSERLVNDQEHNVHWGWGGHVVRTRLRTRVSGVRNSHFTNWATNSWQNPEDEADTAVLETVYLMK